MARFSIFILGCGIMQTPALRIARDMGWHVAAADGNPRACGRELCDQFFPVDLRDVDGLIATARKIPHAPQGVFTAGTDFSLSVALVAEALGLPGHAPSAARRATDKVLMRQTLRRAGIPSPDFIEIGPHDDAAERMKNLPGPWVVKPVDSMGARGVVRVDNECDAADALGAARSYSQSGRALVETFIEGPEYSLDALVEDGRLIRCGLADRHIAHPPYFIEMGHTIPSSAADSVADELWDTFARGVAALGLSRGAAKGDLKFGPDGPVIGEIAARLSGGYMSGWTFPHASGIESIRGGLRLAVGLGADTPEVSPSMVCAERALVTIDGTLRRLEGREKALALPGVTEVFFSRVPGDRLSFPRNNVEKVGNVIALGPDRQTADERALAALQSLTLELDATDPSTGIYLDTAPSFPPDVFDSAGVFDNLWRAHAPRPSRASAEVGLSIAIPGNLPDSRDSAGRTMREVVNLLSSEGRLGISSDARADQAAADFWKALVRGGLEGARWYLDRHAL